MIFDFFKTRKNPVVEVVQPEVIAARADETVVPPAPAPEQAGPEMAAKPAVPVVPEVLQVPEVRQVPEVAQVAEVAASANVSVAAAEPPQGADEPKAEGQRDTLKVTREDVIAAYKIFLGRQPESLEVVDPRVGVTPMALLIDFLASKEFLDQPSKAQLVLVVAKKILDSRQAPETKPATDIPSGQTT